jgi:hypothetical protein
MTEVKEITIDEIKRLAKALKRLKKDWITDMVEIMGDPEINADAIYNICNGIKRHQQHRRAFVIAGTKLLEKLNKEQNKALKMVEDHSSGQQD